MRQTTQFFPLLFLLSTSNFQLFSPLQLFTFNFQLSTSLDLRLLAAKPKSEVEKILGLPVKKETHKIEEGCACERVYYLDSQLYITYFEGKADLIWVSTESITVTNYENLNIRAWHRNTNPKWMKFFCINSETRKCCQSKGL